MSTKHKAKLTISRPRRAAGKKYISIQVRDEDARVRFLDIEMDYADFAECVTGMSEMSCLMEVRDLGAVGKKIERQPFEFKMPEDAPYRWDRDYAIEEAKRSCPCGWKVSTYFGSQNSFFTKGDEAWARTTISRWVDKGVECGDDGESL